MDVSAASLSALSQAQTKNKVDVAVAKKTLDAQKQTGDAVVAMIAQAADQSKSQATAGRLDLLA
jgi:hypothetical protein